MYFLFIIRIGIFVLCNSYQNPLDPALIDCLYSKYKLAGS